MEIAMLRLPTRSLGPLIALCVLAAMSAFGPMSVGPNVHGRMPGSVTSYGPLQRPGQHTDANPLTPVTAELPISDQAARQLALRSADGAHVASRMLHRVTTPLTTTHPNVRYVVQTNSPNWGGYVDVPAGGSVQGSFGEFNDEFTFNGGDLASWTGVGGFNGNTVVQTGVDNTFHEAWTEAFPNPPIFWFSTNPGDLMASQVELDHNTGKWYMLIEDLTTGLWHSGEFALPGADQSSVEWITEAVQGSGNVPFGSPIPFSHAVWHDHAGTRRNILDSTATTFQVTLI